MKLETSDASGSGSDTGAGSAGSYSLLELGAARASSPAGNPDSTPETPGTAQGEAGSGSGETEFVKDDGTPLAGSRLGQYPCMVHWVILFFAAVSALGFCLAVRGCKKRIRQLEQELGNR